MVLMVADGLDDEVYYYTDAGTFTDKFGVIASQAHGLFVYNEHLYVVETDASFGTVDAQAYSLTSGSIGDRESGEDINFSGGSSGTLRVRGLSAAGSTLWVRYHNRIDRYSLTDGTFEGSNTLPAWGTTNSGSDMGGLAVGSRVYVGDISTATTALDGPPAVRVYTIGGSISNPTIVRAANLDIILPTSTVIRGLAIVGNNQQLAVLDAGTTDRILLYDL